jgi:DNA repair protein RadA/Sms
VGELDRVLGGGLVPGSVTLLGGEPGIGKSTLTLQAAAGVVRAHGPCLLVSGEESAEQVSSRACRLGATPEGLYVLAERVLPDIDAVVRGLEPVMVVVDSIQTTTHPDVAGSAGSVSQVRECAHALVHMAKTTGTAVVLVGHVTKEGDLAGPRVLEHAVDTVLSFEGDRHHALRMLRVVKHRFGPAQELGVFEMRADGLADVPDPSGLFLADRRPGLAGSAVTAVLEGARPLLVEVQALVVGTNAPMPRRSAQGVDTGRLGMLLAVLERHADIALTKADVYVSVAGGLRVGEPGVDLAVAVAAAGASGGFGTLDGTVVVGELGLGGEVRQVAHGVRRLAEAARLGFRRAVVPRGTPGVEGMQVVCVDDVRAAVAAATTP